MGNEGEKLQVKQGIQGRFQPIYLSYCFRGPTSKKRFALSAMTERGLLFLFHSRILQLSVYQTRYVCGETLIADINVII